MIMRKLMTSVPSVLFYVVESTSVTAEVASSSLVVPAIHSNPMGSNDDAGGT